MERFAAMSQQNENLPPIKSRLSGCLPSICRKPSEGVNRLAHIGHHAVMLRAKLEKAGN